MPPKNQHYISSRSAVIDQKSAVTTLSDLFNQKQGTIMATFLFTSLKGGVGKTSLAQCLSLYTGVPIVTNDIATVDESENTIQIESNLKRIPPDILEMEDLIFDFGAMSTAIDPKIAQAAEMADVIVIPTLLDMRSIEATTMTYNFVKDACKPVVIIANNFTGTEEKNIYADRFEMLESIKSDRNSPITILRVRKSTLIDRITRDGPQWYESVFHKKGLHMLKKFILRLEENIFEEIFRIGGIEILDD